MADSRLPQAARPADGAPSYNCVCSGHMLSWRGPEGRTAAGSVVVRTAECAAHAQELWRAQAAGCRNRPCLHTSPPAKQSGGGLLAAWECGCLPVAAKCSTLPTARGWQQAAEPCPSRPLRGCWSVPQGSWAAPLVRTVVAPPYGQHAATAMCWPAAQCPGEQCGPRSLASAMSQNNSQPPSMFPVRSHRGRAHLAAAASCDGHQVSWHR